MIKQRSYPTFFLRLFPKKILQQCYQGLEQKVLPKLKVTSDHQVLQLVILFAICLVRSKKHPVKVELKTNSCAIKAWSMLFECRR